MQIPRRPQELAPLLWVLLGLFVLRVVGQALVAFFDVAVLPPMQEWYSGVLPYRYLLPAQIAIICLMAKVCFDFSRGKGYFANTRRLFARPVLYFGVVYLAAMVVRYGLRMYLHPEARWFGGTIPIFFHWILAFYVIAFGLYHKARLERL
jgi:hypothetical protein